MKKLLLSIFWLLMVLLPSFSSAEFYQVGANDFYFYSVSANITTSFTDDWSNLYCVYIDSNCSSNCWSFVIDWVSHSLKGSWNKWPIFCWRWNTLSISSSIHYFYYIFSPNFFNNFCSKYTSLECQLEYNLIPIESVTENYCTSNFNLISPSDCPVSWWTWDINWSSVWINNQQVVWSPNIFLNIYDKLDWSQTYVNQDMYIDVNGPEGDEEYINWIIGINTYRPTSEDFTTVFVSGLTLLFPYIVITLFVLFIRKLIRKIFK